MTNTDLHLGFRFGVFFFAGGIFPNPIDIRFQSVSGLSAELNLQGHAEGGQNLYTHRLPDRVEYGNLVLERGIIAGSPLHVEFVAALNYFKFAPSNVIVTLLGEDTLPVAGWTFIRAFPVKWAVADLDATSEDVTIETLELAYARMQVLRI